VRPPGPGSQGAAEAAATAAKLTWNDFVLFRAALDSVGASAADQAACVETIRLLLDAGAEVSDTDYKGRNVLFYGDSKEAALMLVAGGADLEQQDLRGWTPLAGAVEDGNIRQAEGLIAAGANVNATSNLGLTVFMHAVSSPERSTEMMRLLVDAGADPYAATEDGFSAFHVALDINGYEANTEESVRSTLEFLLHLGLDINHRTRGGVTPLMRASTPVERRILTELGARRPPAS